MHVDSSRSLTAHRAAFIYTVQVGESPEDELR
jgi:hypothetical protein